MKTNTLLASVALLVCAGLTSAAEISLESAPPVVVKTFPVAGATDVDPALADIRVTYSKAMMDQSWSWSTWGGENYPETTGDPKYLRDDRTCVLPVKLQPQKFYAIWLNSDKFHNFKDASGRPAVPYLLTFFTGDGHSQTPGPGATEQQKQTPAGQAFLEEQLKLANAGNYWAQFKLWQAYSHGDNGVPTNAAEADKWLAKLVENASLAIFEPANGFNPQTPGEMLAEFSRRCGLFSGRDSLGGASFFRTKKQDGKLIGSFLTATPDAFREAINKDPNFKLISIEKATPEMFLKHEASKQESL